MSDEICDVCGEDPGKGSTCQSCGSRQYRYATDELYESEPADEDEGLEDVATVLQRQIGRKVSTSQAGPEDTDSAAWSQSQQRATIDQLENPEATGPLVDKKKGGCGCAVLFIVAFLIAGIALFLAVFTNTTPSELLDSLNPEIVFGEQTAQTGPLLEAVDLDSWAEVRVGDCFNWDRDEGGTYPPIIVDCREPHAGEFFFIGDLEFGDYPGVDTADVTADNLCLDEFGLYVGVEYSESIWYSNGLYPSQEQWDTGDTSFHCLVYLPDQDATERAVGSRK
jgi:hypothetical protein